MRYVLTSRTPTTIAEPGVFLPNMEVVDLGRRLLFLGRRIRSTELVEIAHGLFGLATSIAKMLTDEDSRYTLTSKEFAAIHDISVRTAEWRAQTKKADAIKSGREWRFAA